MTVFAPTLCTHFKNAFFRSVVVPESAAPLAVSDKSTNPAPPFNSRRPASRTKAAAALTYSDINFISNFLVNSHYTRPISGQVSRKQPYHYENLSTDRSIN
jgi:hypothetical protein